MKSRTMFVMKFCATHKVKSSLRSDNDN